MFNAPHGALCAALLAPVLAVNRRAIEKRLTGPARATMLQRFDTVDQLVGEVDHLVKSLGIPSLRSYGIDDDAFGTIVENAGRASSMKGNPVGLTDPELREILERAW